MSSILNLVQGSIENYWDQIDDTLMQKNLAARLALADKKYFYRYSQ